MSQSRTLDSGWDVHQDAMAVAAVAQEHAAEVISLGTSGTRHAEIAPHIRNIQATAPHLVLVDDAGPWGSWRYRSRTPQGHRCGVVAPALMPDKAGDRVHTARRAAMPRARLMRSGALTPVDGPTVEAETLRNRTRARDEALRDLQAAQRRLNACLLRHDIRETGRATLGPAHLRWRAALVCPTPAQPIVFQEEVRAIHAATERLQRLDQARHEQVHAGVSLLWSKRFRPFCSSREGGRHQTDARQVVITPRISAGSPVVASWLRLFRCTESKNPLKTSKTAAPDP